MNSKYRIWLRHPGYNDPTTILAAVAVIGTGVSINSSNQAAAAQRKSMVAQKKISDVTSARERVAAARQMRIQRAQILAAAGNEGVGGSGVAGATSSLGSQYGSNIGNSNVLQTFGNIASMQNQKAVDAQSTAATWQAVSSMASSAANWKGIFGGGQTTQWPPAPIETR